LLPTTAILQGVSPRKVPIPTRQRRPDRPGSAPALANLSAPHQHFVLEYLANGYNATAAYARAYPTASRKTAAVEGWRLLRSPALRNIIAHEERKRWKRIQMDGDEALALISEAARADIADCYGEDGTLLPVRQWPKRIRRSVRSIRPGPNGDTVQLYDALRARELMAQSAGRLNPVGTIAASLATLAQLLTGTYDREEDTDDD
jgi:phage terminase small subunit